MSWRSPLPGKTPLAQSAQEKQLRYPACQRTVCTLKPTTPVASHAFSKQSTRPPMLCAYGGPSLVLSIAGSKPFAEEAELVSSGEM